MRYLCFETNKPQDASFNFVGVVAKKKPNKQGLRAREHKHARTFSFHVALPHIKVPHYAAFVIVESKAWQPHPVEQAFKKRRHGRPPVRIKNDQMVGPFDCLLQFF